MMTKYTPIFFVIYWGCFFIGTVHFNKWFYHVFVGNTLTFWQSLVMVVLVLVFFFTLASYLEWIGKMKLTLPRNVSNLKEVEQLGRFVQVAFDDIGNVINGNIEFNQNIGAKQITCAFLQPNLDTVFNHGLGRMPQGFFIVGLDVASIIYNGAANNTVELIYLKASVAPVNAKVMVY